MTININNVVEKANSIDTDYRGKTKHVQCLSCKHGCPDFEFVLTGNCTHYEHRMSLKEINEEIRFQGINLRKLCKNYNLKYYIMQDMLKNKLVLSFKYYHILELAINENLEYNKYVERFNNGE